MKRQFNLLASVLLVIAMVFAFASCDIIGQYIPGINQPEPEHEHSYVDGKCECGEADPNYVAPHEHSYVDGKCECGEADPNYKAPHEHSYVDGKCECGEADPNYKPECTEHTYGEPEVIKAATCTESGEEKYTCSACGATETSEIAPLGHDLKTIAGSEPTCTEPGLTDGKQCKVCGEITLEQAELGAKGHEYVDGVCSRCDAEDPDYKGPVTYVFDAQNLAELSASTSNLGKVLEGDIDEFFTFYMSDKTKIESGKKATFEDGYSVTSGLRLNLNGASDINTTPEGATEPINKNVLMFSIPDGHTATVKVWWTCGGDGRELAIFDEEENIVAASKHNDPYAENEGTGSAKNYTYVDTLSIESDGIFYLGTDNTGAIKSGGNIWWKVEVTVTPVEEAPANEIKVETTDTYTAYDLDFFTFTATAEGYYTFKVPAGLGILKDGANAPEIDYYDNANGHEFTIGLKADQEVKFWVSSTTKDLWTIEWSFEEGEVEAPDPGTGNNPSDSESISLGNNTVVIGEEHLTDGKDYTFVVTTADTYTFKCDLLAIVLDANGMQIGRGVVYLEAGTYTVKFISTMLGAGTFNVTVSGTGSTEEPDPTPDPSESDLVLGENTVVIGEDQVENGVDLTFVVVAADNYNFASNDLLAIIFDANGMQIGRYQAYLEVGTYTVKFVSNSGAGTYTVTISGANSGSEEPSEPDGSYDNPFVIDSFPYTGSVNIEAWGTVYYTFTATADGYITVTATEGDLTCIAINDKNVATLKYAVLAGNTYVISIYNDEATTHNISVTFEEAELTADDYKAIINNSYANTEDWSWGASFTQLDDGRYIVTVSNDYESNYHYYSYEVVFNADGTILVTLTEMLDLSDLYMDTTGDEYVLANGYSLLLTPGEYGYTLAFVTAGEPAPHEHNFVGFSCTTDGVCSCGETKLAGHTITYVAAVVATNCQETGHNEYWHCSACDAYFGDAEASSQLNPGFLFNTGDCQRPEGTADCATVPCILCGEDTYGDGEHDVFACKGGKCSKCNTEIEGYGCENYDTPACQDGVCYYCGGFVAGFGHENGAWAPCCPGECSYGCGLAYPATEPHVDEDEDGYCDNCWSHLAHDVDPCVGGECSICWEMVEPSHDYDHVVTNPTCTADGYTTHTCALCDHSYTDSETEALGHADDNGDFKCDKCSTKMLPADGTALTIPQALAIAKLAGSTYTTQKYYITGIIKNVYNTQYGNMYIKDAEGNELCLYGLYSYDGKIRYDAMEYKPVAGDEITVYTVLGAYTNDSGETTYQGKSAWLDEVVHNHNYAAATCTLPATCVCGETQGEALGHSYEDGSCTVCGSLDPDYEGEVSAPTYVKVTSADELTTGTYVVVVNGYVMTKYDSASSGWVLVEKFTGTGDTIVSDSISTWTLTVNGSSVTLKDANGTFIKPKSGNNNGIQTGSYSWAWTINNGNVNFKGTGSDTTILAANAGSSYKIRAYKTSTVSGNAGGYPSNFTLYKLVTD